MRLIDAVIGNETVEVKKLLAAGACPHQVLDAQNITPLHFAVQGNALASAFLLLESGASPLAETADGETPLDTALIFKHLAMHGLLMCYAGAGRLAVQ